MTKLSPHSYIFGFCIFFTYLSLGQATICYQCLYIKGVTDRDSNPDCVNNVEASSIRSEEGAACVKAEGRTGEGNWFVLRLAYRPGFEQISLPAGQSSAACVDARVNVTRVGGRKVDTFDDCQVCNDKEGCNSSGAVGFNVFLLFAGMAGFFLYR